MQNKNEKYAHSVTENIPELTFAFADVDRNLKNWLNGQKEGEYTISFASINSLHDIFEKFCCAIQNDGSDNEN